MTLQRFAEPHRLRISRDECGNDVIRGKHGHLYAGGGEIWAMWVDAKPMMPSNLAKLSDTIWQGDISADAKGRVQDAWVRGIRPEAYELAIRLVGAKRRRIMSPAQRPVLEKARQANPLIPIRPLQEGPLLA